MIELQPRTFNGERKEWMMTFTGKKVFPLNVTSEDISILDIAHSLALQCRYNGHVSDFYSVAEHCLLIARALRRDGYDARTQLSGLLHDSPETYLSDMVRPIKNALGPAYDKFRIANDEIEARVFAKYGLSLPMNPAVKLYDNRIVNDEKRILFGTEKPWDHGGEPLRVDIQCYDPRTAERHYKFEFYNLMEEINER